MPLAHTGSRLRVMPRLLAPIFRRRTTGPKKSRVRIGPWPFAFYVALCVVATVVGLLLEEALRRL